MHKRIVPSLVVLLIIAVSIAALTVRTKKLWTTYVRQNTREALESELTVLRHLISQRAQSFEDNLIIATNGKTAGKFLYTRIFVGNNQRGWAVAETKEPPSANSYFLKQVDMNSLEPVVQWLRLTDAKGEIYAGLILPVNNEEGAWRPAGNAPVKALAFGVLKDPFSDILEIFKGGFASFMLVDNQQHLIAHTSEEYRGAQAPKDLERAMNLERQEVFLRTGSAKRGGYFISLQKMPTTGVVLAAEVPEKNSLLFWYRWLFELVAGSIALLLTVGYVTTRRTIEIKKADVVPEAPAPESQGALERIKKMANEFQMTSVFKAVNKPTEDAKINLKPMIIDTLADLQNDIRLYGLEVEEILEDVPDISADEDPLKATVNTMIRLSFANVHKNMAKKIRIQLRRAIHQIEVLIIDNGLPRKTNLEELIKDISGNEAMASQLTQAVSYVKSRKGDVALNYDFYKGNQILIKIPIMAEGSISTATSAAQELPKTPFQAPGAKNNEEINKRFHRLKMQELPITVRKPKVKELEND